MPLTPPGSANATSSGYATRQRQRHLIGLRHLGEGLAVTGRRPVVPWPSRSACRVRRGRRRVSADDPARRDTSGAPAIRPGATPPERRPRRRNRTDRQWSRDRAGDGGGGDRHTPRIEAPPAPRVQAARESSRRVASHRVVGRRRDPGRPVQAGPSPRPIIWWAASPAPLPTCHRLERLRLRARVFAAGSGRRH